MNALRKKREEGDPHAHYDRNTRLIAKVFFSCSELNECESCEDSKLCTKTFDIIMSWSTIKWLSSKEVFELFDKGCSVKEIADRVGYSVRSVYRIIGVMNRQKKRGRPRKKATSK